MEKNQENDGVIITKEVEEVVKLGDLDLQVERLEGQRYEANIRLVELQNVIVGLEAQIKEKKDLKEEIINTFPELKPEVKPVEEPVE